MSEPHLLVFGNGYSGAAAGRLALAAGWRVTVTSRRPAGGRAGPVVVAFDDAAAALTEASHVLVTAGPGEAGDPVLAAYAPAIGAAKALRWIGYLSTTGVYGDRLGGWVDEATAPAPGSPRSQRRLEAERGWERFADRCAVDLIRLAGIYGPGRSALDDVREGTARRIIAPGHLFGRIHRDDIAGMALAAMARRTPGVRVLHGNDDLPAASADVVEEAARLLGVEPPRALSLEAAWAGMRPMGRSFWAENRCVSSRATQAVLARRWTYPTYREGLRAILLAEAGGLQAGDEGVQQTG